MFYRTDALDLEGFMALIDRRLTPADVPIATEIVRNVPIYDCAGLTDRLTDPDVLSEWAHGLGQGAGVLVLRGAFDDVGPVTAATQAFERMIAADQGGGADHFAAAGTNARVWNAAQKLCLAAPEVFAAYHGNPVLAAVCRAWLGPAYQVTAQVNLVRPGGQAQTAHRDYHLGFQSSATAAEFPAHVHDLTAALTLQGAVAHCDMPVESGPTKLLPFSQLHGPGYLAFHDPDFRAVFEQRCVQIPLRTGDALFFNPALFHGAGENRSTDIQRMANLLQVSSAFGRAMEAVDRDAMCRALYPVLLRGELARGVVQAAIASCAEGYAFPTNLDSDPPSGGNAPPSQADLMRKAVDEEWSVEDFGTALDALAARRRA